MNRSIAKTRNQLQRITLKINQLKTKYTGDVYMHSNPTLENSPISSHTPPQNPTQFRQSQKQYQRPRDFRDVGTFASKPIQTSGSKNYNQSNSQLYNQNQSHSQAQMQTYVGNEELYQKQFKIFRNQIYNYIEKCMGVNKQKQQQIIQKTIQKYGQKQKILINQSIKSKTNLQQRIKKIQQQTTNCLTNIQDLLIQVKKNERYTNQKIATLDAKTKKQFQELHVHLKKISGVQADGNISTNIEQIHKKLITIDKLEKQLKQESIKQSEKMNNLGDKIQQINIKMQNLENRTNKKISENLNMQEELISYRYQSLHQDITKYQQFNIMLEKQILQLKTREEQYQIQAHQNQQNQSRAISRLKQEIHLEFQQKISLLQENLQKNLTDMASVAETLLSLENRFQQSSTSQTHFRELIEGFDKKICSIQNDNEKNNSSQVIYLLQKQKLQVLEQVSSKLSSNISIQTEDRLKKSIETLKRQLQVKINEQIIKQNQIAEQNIESSLGQKLTIVINKHEEQILEKIVQIEQGMIKVEQIQHMFNDFKNKLCEQIQAQVSHSLAIHEENMIEKIKNQQIITNSLPLEGAQDIEATLTHKLMQQVQERLKSMTTTLEATLLDQYKQMKKEKLNNIECHHDDLSEQILIEIQNKVKSCVFEDFERIKAHIGKVEHKIIEICNHLQCNNVSNQAKQWKEDCNNQTLKRNDTLESSEIGSQNQKNSPKAQEILEQKKVIEVVEQKLTQFQNDINETIKLLYEDIENKVNDVVNNSGIVEFRIHFQIFKSELSSLSTLINSIILTKQTKNQEHHHKNIQNQLKLIKNQIYRNSSEIYSQMSTQIAKISTVLQKTCQEVQLKVEKLDRNFQYTYERLSKIEYDNAHFKDKLSYFLSSNVTNTGKDEIKLIIEPKSQNSSNILDILGRFSVGKSEAFDSN